MAPDWIQRLRLLHRHNVATIRHAPLAEISGSLGDLGTLLPLMIALALQGSIDLGSTLFFSGLFNVLTGVCFGIPLPVQPMKAIAAAAIAGRESPSIGVVAAAGQWVGFFVLVMSLTGVLRWATNVVPVPVVKGIQLGAGLSLVMGAGNSLLKPLEWITPILDNRLWAILAFLVLIATQKMPRFPFAFNFFILAIIFAFIQVKMVHHNLPSVDFWQPAFHMPQWFSKGDSPALWMAIGQLPLTTLNSIIAVSALAGDLLPDMPTPGVTSMGLSVALMNLTGTWFGAMPVCHGSGGLAAQYRFGARSGASVIILGLAKMFFGVVFGETLVEFLAHYPKSILGITVLAAGLELAKVGHSLNKGASDLWEGALVQVQARSGAGGVVRKQREVDEEERIERWTVMLMTTGGIMAFRNDALGFLAGILCHLSYRLSDRLAKRRPRNDHTLEGEPLIP